MNLHNSPGLRTGYRSMGMRPETHVMSIVPRGAPPALSGSCCQRKQTSGQPPQSIRSVILQAAITPGIEYRPSLSRQTTDPLPPLGTKATGLVQLGEGMWCLRQDFWLIENIYINTHIVQLRSGGLLMVSPPARTEEAQALLDSIPGGCGRVEHVVVPNLSPEHWYNAADWGPLCAPGATLWTAPGMLEGRATAGLLGGPEKVKQMRAAYGTVSELPELGPLPGLPEVEVATFNESLGFFTESTLWLRDYRAVVFADMAFAAYKHPLSPALGEQGAKMAGIAQKLGCPVVYMMLLKDKDAARAWLERLTSWDVDVVLAGHLDPLVANAKEELRRCFGFLLAQ